MNNEIWKDIEGYEGKYQVSNMGNVKSLNYQNTVYEKNLKKFNHRGYYYVTLCLNGKIKNYLIHRLVAQTFVSNPDNLPWVNHRNEIKTDNRAENLEFCTASYNRNYGKMKDFKKRPVKQFDLYGNYIKDYSSCHDVEQQTGISYTAISCVCRGIRKTAGGFNGKYAD